MSEVTVNRQIKLDNVRLLRVSLTKEYIGKDAKVGAEHIQARFLCGRIQQIAALKCLEVFQKIIRHLRHAHLAHIHLLRLDEFE